MNLAIANTGGVRILSAVSTAGVTAGTLDQPIKRLVKVSTMKAIRLWFAAL